MTTWLRVLGWTVNVIGALGLLSLLSLEPPSAAVVWGVALGAWVTGSLLLAAAAVVERLDRIANAIAPAPSAPAEAPAPIERAPQTTGVLPDGTVL